MGISAHFHPSTAKTIFEVFKSQPYHHNFSSSSQTLYFQILARENPPDLQVLDRYYSVVYPDSTEHTGRFKQLLILIEAYRKARLRYESLDDTSVDECEWEMSSYLDGIISLMRGLTNVIDDEMSPLQVHLHPGEFCVRISDPEHCSVHCKLVFKTPDMMFEQFYLLSQQHVLCDGSIWTCQDLDKNFNLAPLLATTILSNQLEDYLSLLISNFPTIPVHIQHYEFVHESSKKSVAGLIIHDIDDFLNTSIEIRPVLEDLQAHLMLDYGVNCIVHINGDAKLIKIQKITETDVSVDQILFVQLLQEIQERQQMTCGFTDAKSYYVLTAPVARELFQNHLATLIAHFKIIGQDKLSVFKIRTVLPSFRFNSSEIDYLAGNMNITIDQRIYTLAELLKELREKNYLTLSDGTHGVINTAFINKINQVFSLEGDQVRVNFFDLPYVQELLGEKTMLRDFPQGRKIFQGFNNLENLELKTPGFKAQLRDYQQYGLQWLWYIASNNFGGCLADDMGLGKTVQTLGLLATLYPGETKPCLLVLPTTIIENWQKEIQKFLPRLHVYLHYGPERDLKNVSKAQMVITTYGVLRKEISLFKDLDFAGIILDESQVIKNNDSKISQSVVLLKSDFRLALSGTPVQNDIFELFSLFRFLNPGMFGKLCDFTKLLGGRLSPADQSENALRIKRKIEPFLLRRTKNAVLHELPEKKDTVVYATMEPELARYYEDRRKMYHDIIRGNIITNGIKSSAFFILKAISELRQLASVPERQTNGQFTSPKTELILNYLGNCFQEGHKALVFANYLDALTLVGKKLDEKYVPYLTMTGATKNRGSLVRTFQENPSIKVFLMTIKTGGVGLNLTSANHVFIFDPWWNPSVENQAIDRVHRIGQINRVFSYRFITAGTIEEKILELQEHKTTLFNTLLNVHSSDKMSLSEEDIDYLFRAM